jgi:hypothetical protein
MSAAGEHPAREVGHGLAGHRGRPRTGCGDGPPGTSFRTKVAAYDRLAEWAFVVFAASAVPTILGLGGRLAELGLVGQAVTAAATLGVVVLGLAELGSGLGLLDFRRFGPFVALGFVAFLVWVGVVSFVTLGGAAFPAAFGWLGLASIVVGIAMIANVARTPGAMTGGAEPSPTAMALILLPIGGIVAWLVWLGVVLPG